MRTTRPPRYEVAALFPELVGLARQTVRLHPRRGPEPPPDASKLGGHFLWPADEPWPICDRPHGRLVGAQEALDACAYVPVLQLRRDDFPELLFPGQADLC
jgi:hypothetical protein